MKRQYKYPEIPKIESELDYLIKQMESEIKRIESLISNIKPAQSGGGISLVGDTFSATNSDEFVLRKAVDSYNYYKFKYQNLISQLNSVYAQATHTHNKSDITGLNEGLVGTKEVDESSISNNKILVYNNSINKLEYQNKPTGSLYSYPPASDLTISADGTGVTDVTLTNSIDSIVLAGRHTGSNVDRVCFRGKSVTAPFTIKALLNFRAIQNYTRGGIGLSDGTRYLVIGFDTGGGGTQYITSLFYSSVDAYSSTPFGASTQRGFYADYWVKVEDDGTNLKIYDSMDGAVWNQRYSNSRTALFPSGVNQAGIMLSFYAATGTNLSVIKAKHYEIT